MFQFGSSLHDLTFVALAAVVCILSSWAAFQAIVRGTPGPRRTISITVLAGLGVWSTHFVAILGLRPDFLIAYSIPETMGSMVLALVAIGGGIAGAASARHWLAALAFAVGAGAGISAMHHLGMYGLSGCLVRFDAIAVTASTVSAMVFSALAVAVSRSSLRYRIELASLSFVAGVVTLHFGSIIGTSLTENGDAAWVMSGYLLATCQLIAVLVILSPVSTIIRRQVAHYREAALSGLVASATGEGIVSMDVSGRVTWANDAFLEMTGLTEREILGACSIEVVRRLANGSEAEAFGEAVDLGLKAVMDLQVTGEGLEPCWQRVRLIPRRAENGELVGFVSAHQDISAEKAAQERLRASEAEASRLAVVAEHAADSILIADAGGHTTWVNASFERLTGYTLAEMRGQKPGDMLQCEETDPAKALEIGEALLARRQIRTEILNASKDGRRYWTELEISPVMRNGQPLQFIAVSRDVSERIEREDRLKEARHKAEAADRMKSEFLARMSHEIRTPMNGVTGLTAVLSNTALDDTQTTYVDQIRKCSVHLLRVVNDILDFSSLEKGQISLSADWLNIQDVAEQALSVVQFEAQERGLVLGLSMDAEPTAPLRGDRERLHQVLLNLLSNAVKFTEAGSVNLCIQEQGLAPADDPDSMRLRFAITDTGVGIPLDMQDRVFEPFRQAEESATRQYGGTGLGLTIARDIIRAMGGRLDLRSEEGVGSTFAFSLCFERSSQSRPGSRAA